MSNCSVSAPHPNALTLIVPGLVPEPLSSCFSRFQWQSAEDEPWECMILRALGAQVLPAEQLPNARLRWPADMPCESELPLNLVCADPVHLQVHRDSAVLVPPQALSIAEKHAEAFADSINELLRSDGLELLVASANHWYLTGWQADDLSAMPLHAVARRQVPVSITELEASARWRQLNSELQMLLHSHPVNEERASQGLLPINSVWFFGGAQLPTTIELNVPAESDLNGSVGVHSDDAEVLRLIEAMGLPAASSISSAKLVVDLSLYRAWLSGDQHAIDEARADVLENLVANALHRFDRGELTSLSLLTGDGAEGLACTEKRESSRIRQMIQRLPGAAALRRIFEGSSS